MMKMRMTRKRISLGLGLGGALVLLILWILHPAARIPEGSKPPVTSEATPKGARRPGGESNNSLGLGRQGRAPLPAKAGEPVETPADSRTPFPKVGPQGGQWGHLRFLDGVAAGLGEAGCKEAIRRTATHLSIDVARISEFEVAARQSILEMEQALKNRRTELSISATPEGPSVPREQEQLSQERYAAARRKALDRLEKFLAQGPVHRDFRWAFDSWASMVATKTRGEDR